MAVPGLVVPISGPAVGSWNAFPLGTLNDDGYELQCTLQGQEISETDAYGMTLVEAIYRGMNWRCRFRGMEWNKQGLIDIVQAFGTAGGTVGVPSFPTVFAPALGAIGDRWTKYSQTLLLTSILGNPPSGIGLGAGTPQTLTALSAGFAPNSNTAFQITSKAREMPLELTLLPYAQGSPAVNIPFSTN
jgi:hypothetical protein